MQLSRVELLSSISEIEKEVGFLIIIKDAKFRNKIFAELRLILANSYDESRTKALNEAIDYLLSIESDNFSSSNAKKIDAILKSNLSKDLTSLVNESIKETSEKLYKSGISDVSRAIKTALSFDVTDSESAAILAKQTLFWIQNYYSDQLHSDIKDILKGYFDSNKTIKEIASEFASKFVDLTDKGFSYFEGLAEYTTYRVANLGNVTGFEKAGITHYQIKATLDDRTSDICRNMDGRVFEVKTAIKFRDTILKLKSPKEIKDFAPWRPVEDVRGIDTKDLPVGMALPPYHFRCRTIVIGYFDDLPEETKQETTEGIAETDTEFIDYENKEFGMKLKLHKFEKNIIDKLKIVVRALTTKSKGTWGRYIYSKFNDLTKVIEVKKKLKNPELTFLHEFGHAVDHHVLFHDEKFTSLLTKEFMDQSIRIVVERIRRQGELIDFSDEEIIDLLKGKKVKQLSLRVKYLLYVFSREELFAESYSQFRNNPGKFKKNAVDFYNYFNNILKKLKSDYENK